MEIGTEMDRTYKYDVFLCHNNKDKDFVREIGNQLEEKGVKVWFDEKVIIPGQPWQKQLEENIKSANSVAIFIGKNGLGNWQDIEIDLSLLQCAERKCFIIPVIIGDCETDPAIPTRLKIFHTLNFRNVPVPLEALIAGINKSKEEIEQTSSVKQNKNIKKKEETGSPPLLEQNKNIKKEDLPYMIDRVAQLSEINTIFKNSSDSNYIWIIHGDDQQAHENLLSSLKYYNRVHGWFPIDNSYSEILVKRFKCPETTDNFEKKLLDQLRFPIGLEIRMNSCEELISAIDRRCNEGLVVLWTSLYEIDWKVNSSEIIDCLLEFGQKLPKRMNNKYLIISLCIKYKNHYGIKRYIWNFLRNKMHMRNKVKENLISNYSDFTLSELLGVNKDDVDIWASNYKETIELLKNNKCNLYSEIEKIYEPYQPNYKLPMAILAEEITNRIINKESLS